jgi:hypothetical protein
MHWGVLELTLRELKLVHIELRLSNATKPRPTELERGLVGQAWELTASCRPGVIGCHMHAWTGVSLREFFTGAPKCSEEQCSPHSQLTAVARKATLLLTSV